MTSQPYAVANINELAIWWLNATDAQREIVTKAGHGVPVITQDDRYVAAERAQQAAAKAAAPAHKP